MTVCVGCCLVVDDILSYPRQIYYIILLFMPTYKFICNFNISKFCNRNTKAQLLIWALFCKALGNVLLSHGRTTLSSAMTRFTVLFEMGRSGSKSLMSPSNSFCMYSLFKAVLLYSFYFCILVLTRWILLDIYSYCIDFIRYQIIKFTFSVNP